MSRFSGNRNKYIVPGMILMLIMNVSETYALHNQDGVHDPSAIVKCDDTYWIYGTGRGPHAMYSKDLVHWTAGETPLTLGTFPSWVTSYVPDFGGHFWAPDCFYMNGKYYLYYSCSSWGVTVSCIGLMTSKSLNPGSPDYAWTDEGVVVVSTATSNYNCIDPAIMRDGEGKIWLTFGSHWDGIRMTELDSVSGKPKSTQQHSVAGKGDYKTEAAYTLHHGDYYYLFFNRGQCCEGTSSTYYIQVGRSSSPNGPFLDKNGTNCYQGGGTTVMSTSGRFIGPGCLGYYVENNTEFVTYHYYDGEDRGTAKLGIGTFRWTADGWPEFTRDWLVDGDYAIVNENSQFAWDISGTGVDQDPVIQDPYKGTSSQKWTFVSLGDGYYSILPAGKDLVAGITPCSVSSGTGIGLNTPAGTSCQVWVVEKTPENNYMFSSKYGNRVLEVPGTLGDPGTQLAINYYSGTGYQKWMVADTFPDVSVRSLYEPLQGISIYPNPVQGGSFNIGFAGGPPAGDCEIDILSSDGRLVFSESYHNVGIVRIYNPWSPGTYFIRIKSNKDITIKKLIIQQ